MAKSAQDASSHDDDLVPVKLPSSSVFWVYAREQRTFNGFVKRYLADNQFTNMSDLQELDRIVVLELLCWRWGVWVSQQVDYWNDPVEEKELSKQIKETSTEIRQLKSNLGIDKVTRDKTRGEDSVSKYLENLKIRAKAMGVTREKQLDKGLEIFHELIARLTLYDNSTDDERREMKCGIEHFLAWLRDEAIPAFDEIDAYFREHQQRTWIREM